MADEQVWIDPKVKARIVEFANVTDRKINGTVRHLIAFAEQHDVHYLTQMLNRAKDDGDEDAVAKLIETLCRLGPTYGNGTAVTRGAAEPTDGAGGE